MKQNQKLSNPYFTANKGMNIVHVVLEVVEALVAQVPALRVQLLAAQDLQHNGAQDGQHAVPHARCLWKNRHMNE